MITYNEDFLIFTYSNLIYLKNTELFPGSLLSRFLYWPIRIGEDFGFGALLLSLTGIIYFLLLNKKSRLLAFCFLSLFIFYIVGCLTFTVACHYEYILNAEVFLIPFITSWILFIPVSLTIRYALVSAATFLCIIGFISPLSPTIGTDGYFNADDKIALEYIREKFDKEDNVAVFHKANSHIFDDLGVMLDAYTDLNIARYTYRKESEIIDYIIANNPDCIICPRDAFFNILKTDRSGFILRPFWIMEDYVVITNSKYPMALSFSRQEAFCTVLLPPAYVLLRPSVPPGHQDKDCTKGIMAV